MCQKALKLPHTVAIEWSVKAIQEQRNCQMKSDWWAICYWLKKKKSEQNKKSYSAAYQQRAKFCLALTSCTALPPHLRICLGVWGRLGCTCMRCRVCSGLGPFPLPCWGQSEGAEGGDNPSVPCCRGMGMEGKRSAPCNDWEKPVYSSTHTGCLGLIMLS